MRYRGKEVAWGYVFIAPALLLFLVMGVYTLFFGAQLSFVRWNGLTPTWEWVGLKNYADLLWASPIYAPVVHRAALNTLVVMIAVPILILAVAFPLAIVLNQARRFAGVLRSVYFVPYVTAGIAVYMAWQYVLEPNGAINLLLRALGLGSLAQPQGWLGNPSTALPTLIVIMVWSGVPVAMLLYLTGLQSIDSSVLEAAQLDGAGWWRTNFSVVLPLLKGTTAVIMLLNVRDALQGFQIFLIMTNGGPAGRTNVLGLETYDLAFQQQLAPTLGLASALGWLLFFAALAVAIVNQRVTREK
ncbi:sugar ABC transporter permease [Cellulosimicrobium cellulans]|jgi:ABC-type sugar transport system permease subunit|nr:sugar ABC transporter permease [Cellulosimicrobium cellulans]KZM77603.1 ABC transporter permease [Cellulosimicrobium sp. I38E]